MEKKTIAEINNNVLKVKLEYQFYNGSSHIESKDNTWVLQKDSRPMICLQCPITGCDGNKYVIEDEIIEAVITEEPRTVIRHCNGQTDPKNRLRQSASCMGKVVVKIIPVTE